MLAQSFTTAAMEDALQLKSFGKWARNDENMRKLRCMDSLMFKDYRSGYKEDPRELIPDINPDYALELDQAMLGLDKDTRKVIIAYYVYRLSWRAIARETRRHLDTVRNQRDMAVSFLYGNLKR